MFINLVFSKPEMGESIEERLGKIENSIIYFARKFSRIGIEVDDLVQIGRIAAWQAGQKRDSRGYMHNAAKYAMMAYINGQRRKKRFEANYFIVARGFP